MCVVERARALEAADEVSNLGSATYWLCVVRKALNLPGLNVLHLESSALGLVTLTSEMIVRTRGDCMYPWW